MNRGLGKLQRAILEALPAHEAHYAGVYDLRAVKWVLAEHWGQVSYKFYYDVWAGGVSNAFEASFSRAVKTLIRRGVLRPSAYVGQNGYPWMYLRWVSIPAKC